MLLFTENWKQHDDDDEDNDGSVTRMKFRLLLTISKASRAILYEVFSQDFILI